MEETTTNAGKGAVPTKEVQAGRRIGRCKLLRALAVSSGAVAASGLVPGKWSKPLVEVGMLPAHAHVTPIPPTETPVPCGRPATPTQISPDDDAKYDEPQLVTLEWSTVPIPEGCPWRTYGIGIQWEEPGFGWKVELEKAGLPSPSRAFPLAMPGACRWRVWASTAAGDSPRSDPWWHFQFPLPNFPA